jgi:hypothetical protein
MATANLGKHFLAVIAPLDRHESPCIARYMD